MSEADSPGRDQDLPRGVTLATSPLAGDFDHLLLVTRLNEHKYLLSVPMELQGSW